MFDKLARRLGLGFPGGAAIEKLAAQGNPEAYEFPRPLIHSPHYEFSFSGLKTAVIQALERDPEANVADLCASFQQAVIDLLVTKTLRVAEAHSLERIALAGGVALNESLRARLQEEASSRGYKVYVPPRNLCMDNGAMIAGAGYYLYQLRGADPLTIEAKANAPLGQLGIRYRPESKYR